MARRGRPKKPEREKAAGVCLSLSAEARAKFEAAAAKRQTTATKLMREVLERWRDRMG